MSTKNHFYSKLKPKPRRCRSAALLGAPQAGGSVYRLRIVTPKKPNSARRPAIKAYLNNNKHAVCHIPGRGHNLKRHSKILISGVGARDLPGVRHSCIRGVYDFAGVKNKIRRRSIYAIKLTAQERENISRPYRFKY